MSPTRLRAIAMALVATGAAALAFAKDLKPTSFRAQYEMQVDNDEVSPVPACAAASLAAFEDARTDTAIGERFHEKTPNVKLPIAMTDDPMLWMQTGFVELARRAVLPYTTEGKPEITIRLASLWVDEQVYRNAEYDGRIVLDVLVAPPGGGATCWSGRVDGFAENYGRAGKEVNYQETVNHALDKAILKTFATPEFADALCSCGGAGD